MEQENPEEDIGKRLIISGEWVGEITEVTLRKVALYGLPYTAIATIKIVDGKAHVINVLNAADEQLTRKDFKAIKKIIAELGTITINFRRYKVSSVCDKSTEGNTV